MPDALAVVRLTGDHLCRFLLPGYLVLFTVESLSLLYLLIYLF